MAEVQGVPGPAGRDNPLTEEQIARKKALGIPVHLTEEEHDYRADGWCNCGERRPGMKRWDARVTSRPETRGKSNLDVTEGNYKWGDRA